MLKGGCASCQSQCGNFQKNTNLSTLSCTHKLCRCGWNDCALETWDCILKLGVRRVCLQCQNECENTHTYQYTNLSTHKLINTRTSQFSILKTPTFQYTQRYMQCRINTHCGSLMCILKVKRPNGMIETTCALH